MPAIQRQSQPSDIRGSGAPPLFPEPTNGPNRTGGLVWHLRALRASARWRPTRVAIANWLEQTRFESRRLVLVGASAGWMMSTEFLARFDAIEAIDIDPQAQPLFALRHGWRLRARGVRVSWLRLDALSQIDRVLERWPDAALLFDNVLGQQIYRHRDLDAVEAALSGLSARLAGREWASIHDWLSGPASPSDPRALLAAAPPTAIAEAGGLRIDGRWFSFDEAGQALLARLGGHGQWQDHRSAGVFPPGTELSLIPWPFAPGKWHWLQAGRVDARTRFEARAARGKPAKALKILDELDRAD